MQKWLCKLGWHKWTTREIHQTAKTDLEEKAIYFMAAVIDRCSCGEARIALGGGDRMTCFVVPTKYKYSWQKEETSNE